MSDLSAEISVKSVPPRSSPRPRAFLSEPSLCPLCPPLGVIEACAERGDTAGALQILEMMRAAREGRRGVCPRPSYRSYLAALGACSRAPTSTTAIAADGDNDGDARLEERQRPEVGRERVGDWQASKRVLGMMWEDEAARKAEGKAAVPGVCVCVCVRLCVFLAVQLVVVWSVGRSVGCLLIC